MKETVERALQSLKKGWFAMVYDADKRENETDLVTPSIWVTHEKVRRLRRDAGGLICVTVPPEIWNKLGLPYLHDLISENAASHPLLSRMKADDIPYDEKSTFSLTINHRETFTGITDKDRARTIKRFAELSQEIDELHEDRARDMFGREFRTPGHVFLLNATEGLLDNRMGHTELTTALLEMGGYFPSMTICEMLGDDGDSLSEKEAVRYGKKHSIPMVEGKDILKEWEARSG
ncbi:MAG: 3,4-dihydroxy-2-butanone-4-phosphate synthase [Candidatus Saliniplasma sp.]